MESAPEQRGRDNRHGHAPGSDGDVVRVVVVGAGFAGLEAAKAIARGDVRAEVTLIDRQVYSTFQPLLYQVATGGLNPGDVTYPVRGLAVQLGFRFRWGAVAAIDRDAQEVVLADGGRVGYDHLVLAAGVAANHFGVRGAAEHSLAMYTRAQSLDLRDGLMTRLERIAADEREGATVVVVGGGPTGVEMAGTLAELRNDALPVAYPEIARAQVDVVLVEMGEELLAPFHPALRRYTLAQLRRRGVEVRLRTSIREVGPDHVLLDGGERLRADITIWAAGVGAAPEVAGWGLPQGRGGRITVCPDLRVVGEDRIFAIGDLAIGVDDPLPQLAQPAIQGGRHVAAQIAALEQSRPTAPFRYTDKGIMATIGRRAAVVELPSGLRLRGTIAWVAWVALHVATLLGNRNRVATLLNLSWRYLAHPGGSGMIVGDVQPRSEDGPTRDATPWDATPPDGDAA